MLSNNGVISKSKDAKAQTEREHVREQVLEIISEFAIDNAANGREGFEEFLNTKGFDSVTDNGDGTYTVEKDGYELVVSPDGTIGDIGKTGARPEISNIQVTKADGTVVTEKASIEEGSQTLYIKFLTSIEGGTITEIRKDTKDGAKVTLPYAVTQNGSYTFVVLGTVDGETRDKSVTVKVNQYSSKYKVGDYVDYKPALETETDATKKTYSLTSDKSGVSGDPQTVAYESGLKWRILNINEDTGKIDILSDQTTATVKFYGTTGYSNGVYALNDICEQLYSNKAKGITARSINLEDMEKNLTPDGFTARNNYKDAVQYGTTKTYTEDDSYYPNYYKNEIGSGVDVAKDKANTITQPDKINGVDPYKESSYSSTLTSGYTKAQTGNLTVTQTYYDISIDPTNYGAASSVLSNSNRYWVASRYVYAYSSDACFGLRLANTNMRFNQLLSSNGYLDRSDSYCLRAIVSLDSRVLTEKTGDTWSTNM